MLFKFKMPEVGEDRMMQDLMNRTVETAGKNRTELMEAYVLKYLESTGLKIHEVEMVERMEGSRIVWYLRKKGSSD